MDARRYHLIWTSHHILLDGWSFAQLLAEIIERYTGKRLPAAVPRRYRDLIAWLQRQDGGASEQFWRRELDALEQPTLLGSAVAVREPGSGHGLVRWRPRPDRAQALQRFAQEQRVTLNTVVQGAWSLLLQRYTGQRTVVFGATVAGRPADLPGAESLLGLFINTLPVVLSPRGDQRVGEWLREVQAHNLKLREHEHTPLYDLMRWAGRSGQALFDSIVVFENYPVAEALRRHGDELRFGDVQHVDTTTYAMTVSASVNETLNVSFDFARAQFDEDFVERLSERFGHVLEQLVQGPERRLGEIGLLTEREAAQVAAWTRIERRYEREIPAQEWIRRRAEERPEVCAVVCEEQRLSYGELEQRANRVAHELVKRGVGPEKLVGISVSRSVEMVVGMLGIWKAGGAYVPLDPAYPSERLAYMMADAAVEVVVTDARAAPRLRCPRGWRRSAWKS